ncbi:MAG TPA: PTS fructose transporter subunit IIA, partial [Nitrospina sp.]|nr:PTS fructose transporter subunit IIA [Nitrospina sp.]
MKIDEILKKESVIADLVGKNKLEVIQEMTSCLKQNNIIKDDQALFTTLMEREKLGSTGIGENVAIPHGKSDELTQIITVFARSLGGVDFESLDQKPVHFVCMVIAPAHSTGQHP